MEDVLRIRELHRRLDEGGVLTVAEVRALLNEIMYLHQVRMDMVHTANVLREELKIARMLPT